MAFFNCGARGVLRIKPDGVALDKTLRDICGKEGIEVMVYASGIQYARLRLSVPDGFLILPEEYVTAFNPERQSE